MVRCRLELESPRSNYQNQAEDGGIFIAIFVTPGEPDQVGDLSGRIAGLQLPIQEVQGHHVRQDPRVPIRKGATT